MRFAFYVMIVLLGVISGIGASLSAPPEQEISFDSRYVFETPTKKLAFVVGNSDYETETKIPSAAVDATAMATALRESGFDVTEVRNFKTRSEFLHVHFLPFVGKIEKNDFVVFYYSGHGFSYSGANYIVPLEFPKKPKNIFHEFISASAVQDLLVERQPGFLLMLLDACRNIASFIEPEDSKQRSGLEKGLAEFRRSGGNIVIGFSSDPGRISIGSSGEGQQSIFTAALSQYVPKIDMDLDDVQKEVHHDVRYATNFEQKPWFSESSSAEIYIRPSEKILAQEREAWLAALYSRDRREIARFASRYSIGRYVEAASKWLEDHAGHDAAPYSRISPIAPEVAWNIKAAQAARSASGSQSVKVRRLDGPLAFDRTASMEVAAKLGNSDILLADDGLSRWSAPQTAGSIFASHGTAVLTGHVEGRASASASARSVMSMAAGDRVQLEKFETGADGSAWAKVRAPNDARSVFIAVPTAAAETTNLGHPLLELEVPPEGSGLKTLVDQSAILPEIEKLKAAGHSISWASIATPSAEDEKSAEIHAARASHLRYLLGKAGVSRREISVVQGATDLKGQNLRVRLFGN